MEELLVRSANQALLTDIARRMNSIPMVGTTFVIVPRVRPVHDVRGGDLQVQDQPAVGIRRGFVLARHEHSPPRDRRWCCFEWQARARPRRGIGAIPSGGEGGMTSSTAVQSVTRYHAPDSVPLCNAAASLARNMDDPLFHHDEHRDDDAV